MNRERFWITLFTVLLSVALLAPLATAQNVVSGDVTGTVTDPSGAVVPNATVTLKSIDTGQTLSTKTNADGVYRVSLRNPGNYMLTAAAPGFERQERRVTITIGQVTTASFKLPLATAQQAVTVTAEAPVLQTENGNISTTMTSEQIHNVPNPGNDLTYITQTAPGATMNTQSGYGNFSTYGLPATSNTFTLNGMNEMDPFLSLNNSGATNLLLGQNDVNEATVINNGYSGQYGGLAGSTTNYVTKSGTNSWHGNAQWFWNGRVMNANNYFNKQSGTPRAFDNVNIWAASIGGPIFKDKTFFFFNTEGNRILLPTNVQVRVPSQQFQSATLANLASVSPSSVPFYQQMFNLYNNAPGVAGATNTLPNGGCPSSFTALGGAPCALQFRSTAGNNTHEALYTGRVDQIIGNNDRAFIHVRYDNGFQATYTDPITKVFNAGSQQPEWDGQLSETHTFSANAVNNFILAGQHYSAIFKEDDPAAALAAMPFRVRFSGGLFYSLGDLLNDFPQGRNVTQYQIVDDFSVTRGNHTFKFGVNFHRNDVTDQDVGIFTTGEAFGIGASAFFNGVATDYIQNFTTRQSYPVAIYGIAFYGQDEWRVRPNLKLTLALRADRYGNPTCTINCFARLSTQFGSLTHDPTIPYNQALATGLHSMFPNFQSIQFEPRFGFAYQPFGSGSDLVFRGGFGLFTDSAGGFAVDNILNNPPTSISFITTGPLAPAAAGNAAALAAGAASSFQSAFIGGGTLASISASNPFFVAPNIFSFANKLNYPRYQEWNFEVQKGLGQKMSLSLNYVGNHGIREPLQNSGVNAFDAPGGLATNDPGGFGGLPLAAPDPRFGVVTELSNSLVSNYNGMTASVTRRFSMLTLQANYTWSHALDELSNNGLPFNFTQPSNFSILNQQDPNNVRLFNYGNADYDVRHYFSANYVIDTTSKHWLHGIASGWMLSGTVFTRSGLPLTITDSVGLAGLQAQNFGTTEGNNLFANQLTSGPFPCNKFASGTTVGTGPCMNTAAFGPIVDPNTGLLLTNTWGNQRRNQVSGPHFFDTDMSLMRSFHIPGWEQGRIALGIQAFNLFNHPNFDQPIGDIQDSQFGTIQATIVPPTSLLGSFLGGDASPRMLQTRIQFTF